MELCAEDFRRAGDELDEFFFFLSLEFLESEVREERSTATATKAAFLFSFPSSKLIPLTATMTAWSGRVSTRSSCSCVIDQLICGREEEEEERERMVRLIALAVAVFLPSPERFSLFQHALSHRLELVALDVGIGQSTSMMRDHSGSRKAGAVERRRDVVHRSSIFFLFSFPFSSRE